jgi:hypothetical protein
MGKFHGQTTFPINFFSEIDVHQAHFLYIWRLNLGAQRLFKFNIIASTGLCFIELHFHDFSIAHPLHHMLVLPRLCVSIHIHLVLPVKL